jgi:hypothetical protein
MAERNACLTVSGSTWVEIVDGTPAPALERYQYKLHCRVVIEGYSVLMVVVYELANASSPFRPLAFGPALHSIPKGKIIRDAPWNRDVVEYHGRIIEPQSYRTDGERWRPKALIIPNQGGSVRTSPVFAPPHKTFATEEKANGYAVEMARRWVDKRS